MNIVVFGANGRVGSLVVGLLIERGYRVKAFVHGKHNFDESEYLTVLTGDIYSKDDIANAINGSGAVISTLGSWKTPKKDILTQGIANIIPAMEEQSLKRIISLTGSDSRLGGEKIGIINILSRFGFSLFAKKILKDGENHISQLENSKLDWTVIRSPVMNNLGKASDFKIQSAQRPFPWQTINRVSVALAIVEQIESSKWIHKAPYINRHDR